jgi:hypothetical protein
VQNATLRRKTASLEGKLREAHPEGHVDDDATLELEEDGDDPTVQQEEDGEDAAVELEEGGEDSIMELEEGPEGATIRPEASGEDEEPGEVTETSGLEEELGDSPDSDEEPSSPNSAGEEVVQFMDIPRRRSSTGCRDRRGWPCLADCETADIADHVGPARVDEGSALRRAYPSGSWLCLPRRRVLDQRFPRSVGPTQPAHHSSILQPFHASARTGAIAGRDHVCRDTGPAGRHSQCADDHTGEACDSPV